jgi:hypothetical protein
MADKFKSGLSADSGSTPDLSLFIWQATIVRHAGGLYPWLLKTFLMQIDVVKIDKTTVVCNLYTGDRCVRIIMTKEDYEALKRDKFFILDGKTPDSAGVLNTTNLYDRIEYFERRKRLA